MPEVVANLRSYLLGWKGYFRLAQTPRVWRELDEWMRHRLRAIQLKHWKRGKTMYREPCRKMRSEEMSLNTPPIPVLNFASRFA